MKKIKLTALAYGKAWKFNLDKYCGYVCCDRLRKVMPISINAWAEDNSWLCDCGRYTKDDRFYHRVVYRGKVVK